MNQFRQLSEARFNLTEKNWEPGHLPCFYIAPSGRNITIQGEQNNMFISGFRTGFIYLLKVSIETAETE